MWPYPQKKQLIKLKFWTKIFFVSFVVHLIFLLAIFVFYRGHIFDSSIKISVPLRHPGMRIVYLPFHKRASKSIVCKPGSVGKKASASTVSRKKVAKKKTAMVQSKKSQQKKVTEKAVPKKVAPVKKVEKPKTAVKKEIKKEPPKKKIEPKKDELQKKKKEPEKEIKKEEKPEPKPEPKPEIKPELKSDPKPEIKKEEIKSVPEEPLPEVEQEIVIPEGAEVIEIGDENIVYMGRDDMAALNAQELLQEAVQSVWRPPVGMPGGTTCELKVAVDWAGVACDILVEKRSGILMFDVSAKSAAKKTNYPKMFWGKTITITF